MQCLKNLNSENKTIRYISIDFKIPYDDRLKAKELKYSWDKEKKSWYKNLYLNKNNKFKLDFDLSEKNNTPAIFECFNNIKISQETEQEKEFIS